MTRLLGDNQARHSTVYVNPVNMALRAMKMTIMNPDKPKF